MQYAGNERVVKCRKYPSSMSFSTTTSRILSCSGGNLVIRLYGSSTLSKLSIADSWLLFRRITARRAAMFSSMVVHTVNTRRARPHGTLERHTDKHRSRKRSVENYSYVRQQSAAGLADGAWSAYSRGMAGAHLSGVV